MSAPSDNMPIPAPAIHSKPLLIRHLPYFIGAAILVALAANMRFDGYVHNILLQATTFAIAVFGLSVVLGLCGQINLAQAAFFGLGAYAVGIGTTDLHVSFWLCLVGGCVISLLAGAFLGMSTLRLGGHYLAMVTISFQQIVTLVMINAIWLTHGPDGVSNIGRPDLFQSSQSYLAFCVAMLAIVGYLVWHLSDTKLGRAMRAVRDNELAAGVNGIDVFRTKIYAFALCALLGGLAGGLFAGGFAYVSPDQFSFAESIVFLTMSLLGGVASPIGSAIGTGLLILIPEWLRFLKSVPGLYLAIYGLFVILIIRFIARRHLGFCRGCLRALARQARGASGSRCLAVEAGDDRRRYRAGSHRSLEIFRRPQGRRWRRHRREARRRARADRAERFGQDHNAQRALGPLCGHGGQDRARRHRHHQHAAASAHGVRSRAHVPEHPPVPFDDGAGERRDRRGAARQHHGREGR
ncbi:ABC-type branched-subunit amino acid transport system permease subunit [Bradyrhizobium sp. LM3.2]